MNTEESNLYLKAKRNQFLVQIRKQKNEGIISLKRQRFTGEALQDDSANQQTLLEITKEFNDLSSHFFECLKANNLVQLVLVLREIRKKISKSLKPPLGPLMKTGILPHVVKLVNYEFFGENEVIQESAWILANVASGDEEIVKLLMSCNIAEKAISLLDHPLDDIQDNAIWILANIAGDSLENRNVLIDLGLVDKLVNFLDDGVFDPNFLSHVSWLISNLCRGRPYPPSEKLYPLIPLIQYFILELKNEETVNHAMWALSYYSDGGDSEIEDVIKMDVIEKVIENTKSQDPMAKAPAIRVIGNILTGNNSLTQTVIKKGVLPVLIRLLNDPKKLYRLEACWAVSNILASSAEEIETVFVYENQIFLKTLFHLVYNDDIDVARECIICITNACSGASYQQMQILVQFGIIELIVETLKNNHDVPLIKTCLEALENVLQTGKEAYTNDNNKNPYLIHLAQADGFGIVETLQNHPDQSVYKLIDTIITNHMEYET